MGFFSEKTVCSICGKHYMLYSFSTKSNEFVCIKCANRAGISVSASIDNISLEDVKTLINKNNENAKKLSDFTITKSIGVYLKIDERKKQWYIPDGFGGTTHNPRIYSYNDVLDFALLEDGGSINKGGLGRAVAGGVLFGGVGAVVGGVTGIKKSKPVCSSLKIKITLNDMSHPAEYINFISSETKKSSFTYKTCEKSAQDIMSLLQVMCSQNTSAQAIYAEAKQEASAADEIKKFKELFDAGIITEEEFNAKKKQLLNL